MQLKFSPTGIIIPALPRPSLEQLRENRPWLRSVRELSPTVEMEVHTARIIGRDEESISKNTYLERIEGVENLLGYQHAEWISHHRCHQLEIRVRDHFIDFPGLIVERDDGSWGITTICQNWDVHITSLDFAFHRDIAKGVPI